MSKVFTDEEFKGYEFRCETTNANVGFKHVCRVFNGDIEVEEAKAVVNWGNRTWEAYQYASVLKESKSKFNVEELYTVVFFGTSIHTNSFPFTSFITFPFSKDVPCTSVNSFDSVASCTVYIISAPS